jgi:hypothetical protein
MSYFLKAEDIAEFPDTEVLLIVEGIVLDAVE